MLAMTRQTYCFCAGLLSEPACDGHRPGVVAVLGSTGNALHNQHFVWGRTCRPGCGNARVIVVVVYAAEIDQPSATRRASSKADGSASRCRKYGFPIDIQRNWLQASRCRSPGRPHRGCRPGCGGRRPSGFGSQGWLRRSPDPLDIGRCQRDPDGPVEPCNYLVRRSPRPLAWPPKRSPPLPELPGWWTAYRAKTVPVSARATVVAAACGCCTETLSISNPSERGLAMASLSALRR